VGRPSGCLKRWIEARSLETGPRGIAIRAREVGDQIARALGKAAGFYADLEPDGRELTPNEAAAVREHLEAVTICLRSIQPDRDIIDFTAAEGRRLGRDSDLRPTISVLRMMQRGLGLALSEDPARRASAMPVEELREFVIPVQRFWSEL